MAPTSVLRVLVRVLKYVFLIAEFITQLPTATAPPRKHPTRTRCVVSAPLCYIYPLRLKSLLSTPCSPQTHSGVRQMRRGESEDEEPT